MSDKPLLSDREMADVHMRMAMGVVLGFIDIATHLRPPPQMSGEQAIAAFAKVASGAAAEVFGKDNWDHFVAEVHGNAEHRGLRL